MEWRSTRDKTKIKKGKCREGDFLVEAASHSHLGQALEAVAILSSAKSKTIPRRQGGRAPKMTTLSSEDGYGERRFLTHTRGANSFIYLYL